MNKDDRRFLSREAQKLSVLVTIGKNGLSPEVLKQLQETLDHHELVKIKLYGQTDMIKQIAYEAAESLKVHLIEVRGFTAVLYKQSDDQTKRRYPKIN